MNDFSYCCWSSLSNPKVDIKRLNVQNFFGSLPYSSVDCDQNELKITYLTCESQEI